MENRTREHEMEYETKSPEPCIAPSHREDYLSMAMDTQRDAHDFDWGECLDEASGLMDFEMTDRVCNSPMRRPFRTVLADRNNIFEPVLQRREEVLSDVDWLSISEAESAMSGSGRDDLSVLYAVPQPSADLPSVQELAKEWDSYVNSQRAGEMLQIPSDSEDEDSDRRREAQKLLADMRLKREIESLQACRLEVETPSFPNSSSCWMSEEVSDDFQAPASEHPTSFRFKYYPADQHFLAPDLGEVVLEIVANGSPTPMWRTRFTNDSGCVSDEAQSGVFRRMDTGYDWRFQRPYFGSTVQVNVFRERRVIEIEVDGLVVATYVDCDFSQINYMQLMVKLESSQERISSIEVQPICDTTRSAPETRGFPASLDEYEQRTRAISGDRWRSHKQ